MVAVDGNGRSEVRVFFAKTVDDRVEFVGRRRLLHVREVTPNGIEVRIGTEIGIADGFQVFFDELVKPSLFMLQLLFQVTGKVFGIAICREERKIWNTRGFQDLFEALAEVQISDFPAER